MFPDKKIRVLVVDDSALARQMIVGGLSQDPNIEVVGYAFNASDAKSKIELIKPDVVTMDVEMPGMNGFEASKIIKQTFPGLPVIIVTAHLGENVARRCLECGIDDYIIQPVHTKVLYEQLGKFLD